MKTVLLKITTFFFTQDTELTVGDDFDIHGFANAIKEAISSKEPRNIITNNGVIGIDSSKVVSWSVFFVDENGKPV